MEYYMLGDPYTATLVLTGAMFLAGIMVYLMLYVMLQKIFASRLQSPSRLKEEVVMCGLEYSEDDVSIPVSRVFADIMKRSLPGIHKGVEEGLGSRILNDWFSWMLILLVVIITIIALIEWW